MSLITAIVDLQYGSTGKGLLAGYLSQKRDYDLVVSANMPNAGHTFVDSEGRAWVNKVLPSGVYSKNLRHICIGPGAVFSPEQLIKELHDLKERGINAWLLIHAQAAILWPAHKHREQENLSGISSTMQGSMEAMYEKMCRTRGASNTCGDNAEYLRSFTCPGGETLWDHVEEASSWMSYMSTAQNILMEGSQGYSLGINAGFYPYCTSRDCTVWRLIADCGMVAKGQLRTIGTARVHPIRVGNTPDGFSGPCYPDQHELEWSDIGQTPEKTTVTQRVRRVFTFSQTQIREAMMANRVDEVFLNFCNYDPRLAIDVRNQIDSLAGEIFADRYNPSLVGPGWAPKLVKYMGFGPQAEDMLDLTEE